MTECGTLACSLYGMWAWECDSYLLWFDSSHFWCGHWPQQISVLFYCTDVFTVCNVAALNVGLHQGIPSFCQFSCSCTLSVVQLPEKCHVISKSCITQDTTGFLFNLEPAQIYRSWIYLNTCSVGTSSYSWYSCYMFCL